MPDPINHQMIPTAFVHSIDLKKFCLDKAIATQIIDENGNYKQAPILETAKVYHAWLIEGDK